ncbi:MAG: penicillin-binding protein 1C [Byssovorax sp.]
MIALGSGLRRALRRLLFLGAAGAVGLLALGIAWRSYRRGAGDPSFRLGDRWHEGHRIVDRHGQDLRELPSEAGLRGRSLPLDALGDRIVLATLVSEDRDFFGHEGIDTKAVVRALGQNLRHGRLVSGASTITQQLVKLLDNEGHPRPRTLGEKLKEAARAENLEKVLSKEAILEAYLNRLSYGHGLTGPESAAQAYLGKSARDLSWAEAAYLAVLPRAPSYLDPYAHPGRVAPRQKALLDALHEQGFLGDADLARALAETVTPGRLSHPFHAPHFTEALIADHQLDEPAGVTRATLDLDLQRDVEGLVRTHLGSIADRAATDAAVMVVDNERGEILAYVGSADFDDPSIAGQLDVIRARRQPGSTLKPFVYGLAFAHGHTSAEMVPDVPTAFPEGAGAYLPQNFDGTFEGPISAREALAGSLNVPAIRLAAELSPGELLATLRALGMESLDRDARYYGLALALGSGEVTLRELASAYVALARGGRWIPLRATLPDEDDRGGVLEGVAHAEAAIDVEGLPVLEPGVSALVAEALSDPLARVRGLHGRGPFDLGFPVAVKTGTSSGFRDTWSAGFTHERTVVAWVGNADGSPTHGLTGATGAGPLFADVMRRAMHDVSQRAPLWDAGLLEVADVCPLSGKLAGPACAEHAQRRFIHGKKPAEVCDLHVHVSARPAPGPGEAPVRCDPEGARRAVVLPSVFDAWLARQPVGAPGQDPGGLPWFARSRTLGCVEGAGSAGGAPEELKIDSPSPGTVYLLPWDGPRPHQAVELRASLSGAATGRRIGLVELVIDGKVVATSGPPYRAIVKVTRGDHEVEARPADPGVRVASRPSRFSVR